MDSSSEQIFEKDAMQSVGYKSDLVENSELQAPPQKETVFYPDKGHAT